VGERIQQHVARPAVRRAVADATLPEQDWMPQGLGLPPAPDPDADAGEPGTEAGDCQAEVSVECAEQVTADIAQPRCDRYDLRHSWG